MDPARHTESRSPDDTLSDRRLFLGSLAAFAFTMGGALRAEEIETRKGLAHEKIQLSPYPPLVPERFGRLVAGHIDKILEAGYAEFIHPDDFDHGHLVWREGQRYAKSFLEGRLDAVGMVLYHTAESTRRWGEGEKDLPLERRTPRSIIGYPDGSIRPASEVLDLRRLIRPDLYRTNGTIFETELPAQIEGLEPVAFPRDLEHTSRSQFRFGLHENGRFETKAGRLEMQFSQQWPS